MKLLKISGIILALIFAFAVVLIPLLAEHKYVGTVNAQKESKPVATESTTASSSAIPAQAALTDYYLPYPGILPDHPLYWLKMARDQIDLFLTKKPDDRFEKLLLFSDKRIGAADVLVKGNKASLGVTTASKAEKYLEQAVNQLEAVKQQGGMSAMMGDQALRATGKHREVLESILAKSGQDQEVINQMIANTTKLHQKVIDITGKKT